MPYLSRRHALITAAAIAAIAPNVRAADSKRTLGKNGPEVSGVGLGTNNFGMRLDAAGAKTVVHAAVDNGITLFDTANVYGRGASEEMLGAALGARRSKVLIATKFGGPMNEGKFPEGGGSRGAVIEATEASLRRLKTDVIDVQQYHRPDGKTPMDETLEALDSLVKQGKVRYIGHSNFDGALAHECDKIAADNGLTHYVSAQNHYSLLTRDIEADLVPACEDLGLGVLPYFPLESGMLTGKYKRDEKPAEGTRLAAWSKMAPQVADQFMNDQIFAKVEKLTSLAEQSGATLLDFAFGWLLSRPYIASVIAGATKPSQIESNVKSALWRPSPDIAAEIDRITKAA
ncbi:MAG: aldo/keto reductase [Rhodobacteraceae bacterium]|nr:aldo/keto reductase [Paracoccaceae bacterium]